MPERFIGKPFPETIPNNSSFINKTESHLNQTLNKHKDIKISPNYLNRINQLILSEKDGVVVFGGGPVDLKRFNIETAWVQPAYVSDFYGETIFHLLYLNSKPGFCDADIKSELNLASEAEMKLLSQDSNEVKKIHDSVSSLNGNKKIILRLSFAGNIAFPLISTPENIPQAKILHKRIERLALQIPGLKNLEIDEIGLKSLENRNEANQEYTDLETCRIMKPIIIKNPKLGDIFLTGIYGKGDVWKYYEIFSSDNIFNLVGKENIMRLDSGCDSGMIYRDATCDCHRQLLSSLQDVKKGGFIFHCPTQDGRGYGIVTKMETEAWKAGIPAMLNKGLGPMNTVEVANNFFGESYDIRSYQDIKKILIDIGFNKINLITDNRVKTSHLSGDERLVVERRGTGSTIYSPEASRIHLKAKKTSGMYFSD